MAGDVHDRAEHLADDVVHVGREGRIQLAPGLTVGAEALGRTGKVAEHDTGAVAVERVDDVDLGPEPFETVRGQVERLEERGGDTGRVGRGALVMQEARERELGRTGAAADRVGGLEDRDLDARLGKGHCRGKAIGA